MFLVCAGAMSTEAPRVAHVPPKTDEPCSTSNRLTRDALLKRALSRSQSKKMTTEDDSAFLRRQTHLYLNNLSLGQVGNELLACPEAMAVYLYENQLTSLGSLPSSIGRVRSLYLQKNDLTDLEGAGSLRHLQKLYVDGNRVGALTGLAGCGELEELHAVDQRLGEGQALALDPGCLAALAPSLRVLNLAGNGLDGASLGALRCLKRLRVLDLSRNAIQSADDLASVLDELKQLEELRVEGNPFVTTDAKYRDKLVVAGDRLRLLDGSEVSRAEREFILQMHIRRLRTQSGIREGEVSQASLGLSTQPSHQGPVGLSPPKGEGIGEGRPLASRRFSESLKSPVTQAHAHDDQPLRLTARLHPKPRVRSVKDMFA